MNDERIESEVRAGFFVSGFFMLAALVAWFCYFNPPTFAPDMTAPSPFKTFNTVILGVLVLVELVVIVRSHSRFKKAYWTFLLINTSMKIGWGPLGFYDHPWLNPVWISMVSLGILTFTFMQKRNRICLYSSNTLAKQEAGA